MASGVGSLQYPYHITRTYCSLARAPHTHPLVFVTAVSHMRAGPRNLLELQALHPAQPPAQVLYSDCTFLYTARCLDPRNTTGAQRASSARSVSPLVCSSDCLPASPPYACSSPSHANRSTGQRNTTQSSTVLAPPVCPHVCDSDSARATTPSSFYVPMYICTYIHMCIVTRLPSLPLPFPKLRLPVRT